MLTKIILQRYEWGILIGLLILSFVPSIGGMFRLADLQPGVDIDFLPKNPRIDSAPTPVLFHLITVIPYCILGAFQFLPSFRKNYRKWHRNSGKALVVAGIISALSGLWMTHYYAFPISLQGNLLYYVRVIIGVSMFVFIVLVYVSIRERKFSQHQSWMIRAYALGQGAGTQVFVMLPWVITTGEPEGFIRDVLMTVAWIINIWVAEWIINKNRTKRVSTQSL
jgi:uncharacterized membrane protein